jgi:DNA-binding NarL/FixJ family response regulator
MRFALIILSLLLFAMPVKSSSYLKQLEYASRLQESNPDSCILISQKVFTLLTDDQETEKGYVYWNLAQAYLYKHQYHTSLFYALKGKALYSEQDTSQMHQNVLATIGWIYFDIGNYQHAVPYHQQALEVAQKRGDVESEVIYTNALGLDALSADQFQKALSYFQKAILILEQSKRSFNSLMATVQNNMGIVYIQYEDWNKAEEFFLKAIENNSGQPSALLETYALLAKVYLNTHRLTNCYLYLQLAEEQSYLTSYSFSLIEYYEVRYEYERMAGDLQQAYHYQSKYLQLYKKINNRNVQEVMNYLLNIQDEKIKQDELLLVQAGKLQHNRRVLNVVLIILTLVVIAVFYYIFKSKAEKSLLKQQLLTQELERKEKQQAELSNKLAFKEEAIETLALTISKRNELVKQVAESVYKSDSKEVTSAWKKFENALHQYDDSSQLSDDLIKDFKLKMRSQFPMLTEKELQLLIDIRHNMSSKELADKYHVEVKSIEMSRYRLRKKLQLEKGVQLRDFIMKFGE